MAKNFTCFLFPEKKKLRILSYYEWFWKDSSKLSFKNISNSLLSELKIILNQNFWIVIFKFYKFDQFFAKIFNAKILRQALIENYDIKDLLQ